MTASDNRILAVKLPQEKLIIIDRHPDGYFFIHHSTPTMGSTGPVYLAYKHGGATHYFVKIGIQKEYTDDYKSVGIHSADKPLSDDAMMNLFPGFMKVHGKLPSKQLRDTLKAWMFNQDIYTTLPDLNSATEQHVIDRIKSRTGTWCFLLAI